MFIKKLCDVNKLTVNQLAAFSDFNFSSVDDQGEFELIDVGDTAEKIAYSEEKSEMKNDYFTDVGVNGTFKYDGITLCISGIVGGVLKSANGFTVDTVKSVKFPLKYLTEKRCATWISSAKCSTYLLMKARTLDTIKIRLICVNPETLEKRKFEYEYNKCELEKYFVSLVSELIRWCKFYTDHVYGRRRDFKELKFPFENVRDGQDIILNETQAALSEHKSLCINAPTGIGKTVSVLYPSVRALSDGKYDRIYYLTSRNSLHSVVFDACRCIEKDRCKIKVLSLVSKDKICPQKKCDRKTCPKLHESTDRIKNALYLMIKEQDVFSTDVITEYARRYNVCPFELSKYAVYFSDIVVCDYNYIFDPYVAQTGIVTAHSVLLVDEAHNLVERVKEMYSATLCVSDIEYLQNIFFDIDSDFSVRCKKLLEIINNVKSDDLFQSEPLGYDSVDNILIEYGLFFDSLQAVMAGNKFLRCKDLKYDDLIKLFNRLKRFFCIASKLNDSYITFFNEKGDLAVSLIDTGHIIRSTVKKNGNAIFFSATLSPEEYYRHMLGIRKKEQFINLFSPFPKENFKVISCPVSTRYSEREKTVNQIIDIIYVSAKVKEGNYMVFLPSYSYLTAVSQAFSKKYPELSIINEKPGMSNEEKKNFIHKFSDANLSSVVGFSVMGGNFSEGVDFSGDKLLGAIIVGIGTLPPDRKRELTAEYFNDRFYDGTKFAYMYPGMNKVFQAGGRVIRSDTDRGFLIVIDDRFLSEDYLENMPESWHNLAKSKDLGDLEKILSDFW